MSKLQPVVAAPHPPAPWQMMGHLWAGQFTTDQPIALPEGLRHVLSPRALLVVLVRYLEGTLRYDEVVLATLARRGARVGLYVDHIWVDSVASVWGGRQIWALPKNLAEFHWSGSRVRVSDERGLVVELSVEAPRATLPWLWLPAPGLGRLDGPWRFTLASLWARLGRAPMCVEARPERYGYRPQREPSFSIGARPFRMRVPEATALRA